MKLNPISVAYSFLAVDSEEITMQTIRIEKFLNEIFPNQFSKVSSTKNNEEIEVIYSINAPIFEGDLQSTNFFRSLKMLLDDTADLHPYFCDFKEGLHGR